MFRFKLRTLMIVLAMLPIIGLSPLTRERPPSMLQKWRKVRVESIERGIREFWPNPDDDEGIRRYAEERARSSTQLDPSFPVIVSP